MSHIDIAKFIVQRIKEKESQPSHFAKVEALLRRYMAVASYKGTLFLSYLSKAAAYAISPFKGEMALFIAFIQK